MWRVALQWRRVLFAGGDVMVNPHHLAHWYPPAAYLYVFWLDALALAWEYLRRHPDYRLDWLRRHRRPEAAHRDRKRPRLTPRHTSASRMPYSGWNKNR